MLATALYRCLWCLRELWSVVVFLNRWAPCKALSRGIYFELQASRRRVLGLPSRRAEKVKIPKTSFVPFWHRAQAKASSKQIGCQFIIILKGNWHPQSFVAFVWEACTPPFSKQGQFFIIFGECSRRNTNQAAQSYKPKNSFVAALEQFSSRSTKEHIFSDSCGSQECLHDKSQRACRENVCVTGSRT